MPIARRATYTTFAQIREFFQDLDRRQIPAFKKDLKKRAKLSAIMKARSLARERLPGGGDSYAKTIKVDERPGSQDGWELRIHSDHEWAEAIEFGTDKHTYSANLGGLGSKLARKANLKRGDQWMPDGRVDIIDTKGSSQEGHQFARWGTDPYYAADGRPPKNIRIFEKRNVISDQFRAKGIQETTQTERQLFIAHELTHAVRDKRVDKRTNQRRGREFFFGIPKKVRDVEELVARNIEGKVARQMMKGNARMEERIKLWTDRTYHGVGQFDAKDIDPKMQKQASMHITKVLPTRGGGKNSETPSYGTRYQNANIYAQTVEHPGARAFFIMRDTRKHIEDDGGRLARRALRSIGL